MTAQRRLLLASSGASLGAIVTVIGAKLSWVTESAGGARVPVSGLGNVSILPKISHRSAFDLVPSVAVVSLLIMIATFMVFLVGPRSRAVALAFAAAGAAFIAIRSETYRFLRPVQPLTGSSFSTGPGRHITAAGALACAVLSAIAIRDAARVPRLRMPESAPADEIV